MPEKDVLAIIRSAMNKSLIACASLLAAITLSADQAQAQTQATDDRLNYLSQLSSYKWSSPSRAIRCP